MRPPRSVRALLARGARTLARRGVAEPRLDVELLLGRAFDRSRAALLARLDDVLAERGDPRFARYARLLRARARRVPAAYLLGEREFFGRSFRVGPGVLVPRPETETLVEAVLEYSPRRSAAEQVGPRVLDVGTGSGAVALSLAAEHPGCRVVGIDRSAEALAYALDNRRRLGLEGQVAWIRADLADLGRLFAPARFDVVVANPPYVETPPGGHAGELAHEPLEALAGSLGPFPEVYRRLAAAAAVLLVPRGEVFVEVGQGQAPAVRAIFEGTSGFGRVTTRRDLGGIERVVGARKD